MKRMAIFSSRREKCNYKNEDIGTVHLTQENWSGE